jgi:hypothetical protein
MPKPAKRGYLITNDKGYLAPYNAAKRPALSVDQMSWGSALAKVRKRSVKLRGFTSRPLAGLRANGASPSKTMELV